MNELKKCNYEEINPKITMFGQFSRANIIQAYNLERAFSISEISDRQTSEITKRTYVIKHKDETGNEIMDVVKYFDYSKKSNSPHKYIIDFQEFISKLPNQKHIIGMEIKINRNSVKKPDDDPNISVIAIHRFIKYNLYQVIEEYKKHKFTSQQMIKILKNASQALEFLQNKGAIHRSITRYYILVDVKEEKVEGYLLPSPYFKELTQVTTHTCGTGMLRYRALEMVNFKNFLPSYDKSVDIWSMGIVIFETFYDYDFNPTWSDAEEIIKKFIEDVQNENEVFDKKYDENFDDNGIKQIIKGCIQEKPEDRLTATEIVKMLKAFKKDANAFNNFAQLGSPQGPEPSTPGIESCYDYEFDDITFELDDQLLF